MSVVVPHATIKKFSQDNTKEAIIDAVGSLDTITIMQNMVLVATYIRPEKTRGGLYLPDSAIEEDVYQGKVGLVLGMGPAAFVGDDERFMFQRAKVHDWVVYRVGDAWDLTIHDVSCRLIQDVNIRLIINDPEEIF